MTREEFSEALLRFGGNLDRWPQEARAAAQALVAADAEAARMLAEFSAFEQTVAEAVRPQPFGAAEIGAVLAAIGREEAAWPTRGFWFLGAGASAVSFAAGFALVLFVVSGSGLDLPLPLVGMALGDGNIGGLL